VCIRSASLVSASTQAVIIQQPGDQVDSGNEKVFDLARQSPLPVGSSLAKTSTLS